MRKLTISILIVMGLFLSACGSSDNGDVDDKLKVISSFTIIRDMAEQVAVT